jgi:EAL domain-containing protein (putative c-di-GMP-specific phosphodiesterase class I)
MAFQPIVNHRKREIVGYEALVRSGHPQLSNPGALLSAGERLGRIGELGQRIRKHVVDALDAAPIETSIFINLHAADLNDDSLFSASSPLCAHATRVVLEITERSSLERVNDVKGRADALRRLGYKIAIDDLGAGYAGLSSFAQLDPDIAKLDMSLVRDIDASEQKRKIVRSMLEVCTKELGVGVVCEGVETIAERDVLDELGSDTQQGYLFGRPSAGFVPPAWSVYPPAPAGHA